MTEDKVYLKIGCAKDLAWGKGRLIYRLLEILPGASIWLTFAAMFAVSFWQPLWAAIFVILFDIYWLLKSVYFSWHLRTSFRIMQNHIKINWMKELDLLDLSANQLVLDWREIRHLVILPYYIESAEIVRGSLKGLLNCGYPADKFLVVLSGEKRAGPEGRRVGEEMAKEFGDKFGKFLFTIHEDQPGELAGKGANETWAAWKAKEEMVDKMGIPYERVMVSVFDVDTVTSPSYFGRLTYKYLTTEKPLRTSFQPIPLFINNIWEAPGLARVISFSSTFFHMMNQMRPERLVSFSSHAFPLSALVEVGFWNTNAVSEDSRIFWRSLLQFDGDWRVEPLNVPVSMDANVAENFWQTMKNLYKQQRRWAYGSADIAYFMYGFYHNSKIPFSKKIYWASTMMESFWSWGTNSVMIFLLGWLPILIGGSAFNTTLLAYNAPRMAGYIMSISMLGIITMIYLSMVLLPPKPEIYGRHKYILMALQWFLMPLTLIISGSIPAVDAQTRLMLGRYMGFWPTPKIRKGIQEKVF